MESDPEQLLQRLLQNDPQSERDLLRIFGPRVARKVMYSIGYQNEDWKDVANEVMLAVLENLRAGKFDPGRGTPLGSYIYGITMNKVRDYFRAKKNQPQSPLQENTSAANAVAELELEKKELQAVVKFALKHLKQKYRRALYLRYFEEKSIPEMAEELGIPPRRVSERIHYALKLMRKEMEKKKYFSIFVYPILIIL